MSSLPKRIDPVGCGCTDCQTGHSKPFTGLDHDMLVRLLHGEVEDATGGGWSDGLPDCTHDLTDGELGALLLDEFRAGRLVSAQAVRKQQTADIEALYADMFGRDSVRG